MSLTTILSAGEFHSLNSLSVGSRLNAVWGKSPGLVYVKDPINALQNQLLNDWKDWDYLLHCESIIPADLSNQQREDLETLLFLGIYISKNTSKTGRLIDKLLKSDSFSPILGKAFWITVFEKKNLRIIPTNNSTTKWTLDINDILEKIRIEKLKEDGYFDPDTILKSSNDKSNQLVNVLSTSYFSALEFKNISLSIFNINMEVLALYAPVLPSSWYTNDMIQTIQQMLHATINGITDISIPPIIQLLCAHSLLDNVQTDSGIIDCLYKIIISHKFIKKDRLDCLLALVRYANVKSSHQYHQLEILCDSFKKLQFDLDQYPLLSQAIVKLLSSVGDEDLITISKALLSSTTNPDHSTAHFLKITQIFYYLANQKSDHHDFLSSTKGINFKSCVPKMVGIVSNQHPLYLETLFNACVIDSNTNLDSSAFALLGIIVSLRTRKSTKKSISTSALDRFEKKLFSMLTHVDITVNRALLFGELCSDPFYKISVNEEENEKLLYPLIDILFNNEGFLKSTESFFQDLYLLANKTALDTEINRSLTLKLESAQFKSLGRIAKAISTYMNHIMSSETDHYFFIYTIFSRMKLFVEELSHKWEKSGFGDLPSQEKAVNSISDGVWKYFKAILFTCLMLTDSYASFLQKQFLKRDSVSMDHYEDLKSTIQCILATLHSLHFITCKFGLGGLSLFDDQISIFSASILKICTQSSLNNYHTKLLESLFGQLTNECIVSNQAILSKQLFYLIIVRNLFDFVGNAYILNRILPFIKARLICPTHISRVSKTQNPIENLILDSVDLSHTIYLKLFDSSTLHRHLVRDHCLPYAHILLENFNHGVDLELLKEGFKGMIRGLSDFSKVDSHLLLKNRGILVDDHPDAGQTSDHDILQQTAVIKITDVDRESWAIEALEIAWKCIELLLKYIKAPAVSLGTKENTRMNELLNSSPNLAIAMYRISLFGVLVEQTRTIGHGKLDKLLACIRKLMLYGADDETDTFDGFGITKDPSKSEVWKTLFESISDASKIDYSRRYHCVVWYLELYDDAVRHSKATITDKKVHTSIPQLKARL